MRHGLKEVMSRVAGLAFAFALLGAGALAQDESERPLNQIKLTEIHVANFISVQPDLAGISAKLQEAGENADPALQAELDTVAKKHGFADFAELDDVAGNISIVMAGLDTESGDFTDPLELLKTELEDVKGDDSITEDERQQLIEELTEAIENTPSLQHKENIEVVKAHRAEIEKALE